MYGAFTDMLTFHSRYLEEINTRFFDRIRTQLPLLNHDVSDIRALREVGELLYGKKAAAIIERWSIILLNPTGLAPEVKYPA